MENLPLIIIVVLILALGIETGWSISQWRAAKILKQKNAEIADLKEAHTKLEALLAAEQEAKNVRLPIQGRKDLMSRIPRFSSEESKA